MIAAALAACAKAGSEPAAFPTPSPSPSPAPLASLGPIHILRARTPTPSPTPVPLRLEPPYTVVVDPGHGGPFPGATHRDADGNLDLVEKDLNLDIALRLAPLLEQAGYRVVLTRDGDYMPVEPDADPAGEGRANLRRDLQARVDLANEAQADILVSIHFNGLDDAAESGTEVYYNPERDFADRSEALALFVNNALVEAMHGLGYDAYARGVKDDSRVGGDETQPHSVLLGTNDGFRAALMPGVIGEALFVTNDADAAFLQRQEARQAIAQAYFAGIDAYFRWLRGGA